MWTCDIMRLVAIDEEDPILKMDDGKLKMWEREVLSYRSSNKNIIVIGDKSFVNVVSVIGSYYLAKSSSMNIGVTSHSYTVLDAIRRKIVKS